jgi:hypothetical protein
MLGGQTSTGYLRDDAPEDQADRRGEGRVPR